MSSASLCSATRMLRPAVHAPAPQYTPHALSAARRDLEVQLKMQQVHVTPVSQALASHRSAAGYKNYGERLYVEGRLDAMRKEKEVGGWACGCQCKGTFHSGVSPSAREVFNHALCVSAIGAFLLQ